MGYYFQAPTTNRGSGGALSRFGSLSVKVKKTTEAFNNYFNSGKSGDVFAESGGFAPSSLPPIIDSRYYRQRKHSEWIFIVPKKTQSPIHSTKLSSSFLYIALKNQATSIPEWILAKYLKREHQLMTQPECHHQSSDHLHIQVSKSANLSDQWTMEVAAMEEVWAPLEQQEVLP